MDTAEHRLWSLPAVPTVARCARRQTAGFLAAAGVAPDVVEVAELLTSELVTNAADHTDGQRVTVLAAVDRGGVRIGVRDAAPGAAVASGPPSLDRVGGRGLLLVERMAVRWGVERGPRTKTVWFELPCHN